MRSMLDICIFKDTDDLFTIIESIKIIQEIDKMTSYEEVNPICIQEISALDIGQDREG